MYLNGSHVAVAVLGELVHGEVAPAHQSHL